MFKAFINSASEAGHTVNPDMNGKEQEGFGMFDTTIHEGQRNYKCESCGNSFMDSGHLKQHINIVHEEQKDHKCEFCEEYVEEQLYGETTAQWRTRREAESRCTPGWALGLWRRGDPLPDPKDPTVKHDPVLFDNKLGR